MLDRRATSPLHKVGTEGGQRSPNHWFVGPALCQLSYLRMREGLSLPLDDDLLPALPSLLMGRVGTMSRSPGTARRREPPAITARLSATFRCTHEDLLIGRHKHLLFFPGSRAGIRTQPALQSRASRDINPPMRHTSRGLELAPGAGFEPADDLINSQALYQLSYPGTTWWVRGESNSRVSCLRGRCCTVLATDPNLVSLAGNDPAITRLKGGALGHSCSATNLASLEGFEPSISALRGQHPSR